MRKKEFFLCVLVLCVGILSLGVGRYTLGLRDIIEVLTFQSDNSQMHSVIWTIRLPRVLLVTLCGMALGLAGYVYQVIFKNPLVSPDVVGASSGCSLGAALAIVLWDGSTGSIALSAFVCGMLAVFAALGLSKCIRGKLIGLVLAGIIINALGSSCLMILKYMADPYQQLPTIEFWLMGGFYNATMEQVKNVVVIITVGIILLWKMQWQLKVSQLGDETAGALGMPVEAIRFMGITVATLLVATSVAVAGLVSWIGLITPHIAKVYSKSNPNGFAISSMAWGALILLVADNASRTLFPAEIPISVLTSLIGAIVLIVLLVKRKAILN